MKNVKLAMAPLLKLPVINSIWVAVTKYDSAVTKEALSNMSRISASTSSNSFWVYGATPSAPAGVVEVVEVVCGNRSLTEVSFLQPGMAIATNKVTVKRKYL